MPAPASVTDAGDISTVATGALMMLICATPSFPPADAEIEADPLPAVVTTVTSPSVITVATPVLLEAHVMG